MMKNTLKEKQATLDVIETILNQMEYSLESRRDTLKTWNETVKAEEAAAKEEGREPSFNRWEKQEAEYAAAFLQAWSAVEKHLEKLI